MRGDEDVGARPGGATIGPEFGDRASISYGRGGVAKAKRDKDEKRRWPRRLLVTTGILAVGTGALWGAIHEIPGFGPALADGVRAVVGPGPVAWAEDFAYGVADRINRLRYRHAKPKEFWDAPPTPATPPAAAPSNVPAAVAPSAVASAAPSGSPAAPATDTARAGSPGFPPPSYAPPFPGFAGDGDGTWIAMPDAGAPADAPAMWKSVVHPDPKRTFAAVAIVAIDLKRIDLRLVAGTQEPESTGVPRERRKGMVPAEHFGDLVAVFNGGFKATHGHYGMMIDGDTFLPPRDIACTIGLFRDGSIQIRTWPALKGSEADMAAYRQTPPCLVEQGKENDALSVEYNKNWGAAVGGETVIRRSAIGIDKAGRTLFYGLGEAVTAQALARAMHVAGAEGAAQLDVNYSYPRFLLYGKQPGVDGPRALSALIPGLKYTSWEYVGDASPRDFFYLMRHKGAS
jgi:hypothetical protein